jgi:uncharacterized protein YjbI with pentapeptide repeats
VSFGIRVGATTGTGVVATTTSVDRADPDGAAITAADSEGATMTAADSEGATMTAADSEGATMTAADSEGARTALKGTGKRLPEVV